MKTKTEIFIMVDRSEMNTIIAALMLTGTRYESAELKKAHPHEAEKYKGLENKLREIYNQPETIFPISITKLKN